MEVSFGSVSTKSPGLSLKLSGDEVAEAIMSWLDSNGVKVTGPHTVLVNGQLCASGEVYVDPSSFVNIGVTRKATIRIAHRAMDGLP